MAFVRSIDMARLSHLTVTRIGVPSAHRRLRRISSVVPDGNRMIRRGVAAVGSPGPQISRRLGRRWGCIPVQHAVVTREWSARRRYRSVAIRTAGDASADHLKRVSRPHRSFVSRMLPYVTGSVAVSERDGPAGLWRLTWEKPCSIRDLNVTRS